jgi:hypothetical protein
MFMNPQVLAVYSVMLAVLAAYFGANGPTPSTIVTTALLGIFVTLASLGGFMLATWDCYLRCNKHYSFLQKLHIMLFAKSEHTFIIPVLSGNITGMRLIDALAYEEHYANDPKAFVGLRQILIPFTNKDDALKWKMMDPHSHLFVRVCDLEWDKGLVKDE